MKGELKKISCDPICGFAVQSHDGKEVINLTMMHAKHAHPGMKVSSDELKKMMKTVKG